MRIGIPKEIKNHEYRVGVTPGGVCELAAAGHAVYVQQGAGVAVGYDDDRYREAGAHIAADAHAAYDCELVIKVKELQPAEYTLSHAGRMLFCYQHFAPDVPLLEAMLARGVSCIAYETVSAPDGSLLLPNRAYGPYQAFNPYHLWLMVVLISGVSLAGYLALRLAGAKRSLPLIGVLGGLVSSAATTLVYARDSAQRAEIIPLAAAVIAIANLTVLVRLAVIGGIAAPDALPRLLPVRWQSRAAAVMAIVVAYLANIVFKFAIMLIAGSRALAWRCAPAFLTSSAGLLLGIAWV